jgi:hypothetical protein
MSNMGTRAWKCPACGEVTFQPLRTAAGQPICPDCAGIVKPVPTAAEQASKLPGAPARPPAVSSEARRPSRPATSLRRPAPVPRPATPSEAISSSVWVPDPIAAPSPDSLSPSANLSPRPPEGPKSSSSVLAISVSAVALVGLIVAVIVIIQQQSKGSKPHVNTEPNAVAAADRSSNSSANGSPTPAAATVTPQPAASSEQQQPPQAQPAPLVPGRTVDLMKVIDLQRDVILGDWNKVADGLVSDDTKFARIALPYDPPPEYDFKIEFTRTDQIDESVVQLFRDQGHPCAWVMNGWKGEASAFHMIGGRIGRDGPTAVRGLDFQPGKKHTSIVKVRKDAIEAYIDGDLKTRYSTNGNDLTCVKDWDLKNKALGIGSYSNSTIFHTIEVTEYNTKGTVLAQQQP